MYQNLFQVFPYECLLVLLSTKEQIFYLPENLFAEKISHVRAKKLKKKKIRKITMNSSVLSIDYQLCHRLSKATKPKLSYSFFHGVSFADSRFFVYLY